MSVRSLESAICFSARIYLNNRTLRVKDLAEWSTSEITPREDEVVGRMPDGIYVAIEKKYDKRKAVSQ